MVSSLIAYLACLLSLIIGGAAAWEVAKTPERKPGDGINVIVMVLFLALAWGFAKLAEI